MVLKKLFVLFLFLVLMFTEGCSAVGAPARIIPQSPGYTRGVVGTTSPTTTASAPIETGTPPTSQPVIPQPTGTPTPTASPTNTLAPTPTATEEAFDVGKEITIEYLRNLEITGSEITFEEELAQGPNYRQYLASYLSEGSKIYGLLAIPFGDPPEGGFKAIVFNHGYIPPASYRTTERYTAYFDTLARSGFVVFKIDYRGHGQSEGEPSGSYFSPGYTIDSISAFKSLQKMGIVDPQGIGMWGHSMAGNLVLRAMLVEPGIKAGVIWAGAVYSYEDLVQYRITDSTYQPPPTPDNPEDAGRQSRSQEIFKAYGTPDAQSDFWKAVSLTENLGLLNSPIQIHHAEDDPVVNIGYSYGLAAALQEHGKQYEFYTYEGGGHNLISPYFDLAMQRTVEFFRKYL